MKIEEGLELQKRGKNSGMEKNRTEYNRLPSPLSFQNLIWLKQKIITRSVVVLTVYRGNNKTTVY